MSAQTAVAVCEYLVKQIVDFPDAVDVAQSDMDGGIRLDVTVDPVDMGRVIGPVERRHLVRKLVVDLESDFDRNHYLSATGCKHFAVPSVKTIDNTFVVFWSQMNVELQLSIERPGDGLRLWYAHHKTWRGDGGLPLSPLGLAGAAISASGAQGDDDRLPSMIDDAMRRIAITIPDTRQISARPTQRFGADRPTSGGEIAVPQDSSIR